MISSRDSLEAMARLFGRHWGQSSGTPMDQVKVIINGDDFGQSPQINEAVIRAFQAGTLTSCSLMVTGEACGDAVRLARANKGLAVGLHLVTVQGRAVLPFREIPLLVDRTGRFPENPTQAGLKYYFSRPARKQLAAELAAQFETFHATGLEPSHVDSHLHMHVHPVIFSISLELAEKFGVKRMRLPRDDFRLAAGFQRSVSPGGALTALIFEVLTRRMKKTLVDRGFAFAERVHGLFLSGKMTLDYALFVLDHLSAKTNEIYFHPAVAQEGPPSGSSRHPRQREFEALVSAALRERLRHPDLRPINYFQLAADS